MTRTFDAPRRLVIQAMTTPDLIKRWLGGVRATVVSAEVDLRVGGKYRYVLRRRDGVEFAFGGVYREFSEERAVQTEAFDDYPGEATVTTIWVEHDGKTTLNLVIRFERSVGAFTRSATRGRAPASSASISTPPPPGVSVLSTPPH